MAALAIVAPLKDKSRVHQAHMAMSKSASAYEILAYVRNEFAPIETLVKSGKKHIGTR